MTINFNKNTIELTTAEMNEAKNHIDSKKRL